MRKGYVILLDVVLALVMIVLFVFVAMTYFTPRIKEPEAVVARVQHYSAGQTLEALNRLGVLDAILFNWSLANCNQTRVEWQWVVNLTRDYFERLVPLEYSFRVEVLPSPPNCSLLYENTSRAGNLSEGSPVAVASRILVGYGENVTVEGYAARAFLANVRSKLTEKFVYFGGLEGNAKEVVKVLELPRDANVTHFSIKVYAGTGFNLSVNGQGCATFPLTPGTGLEANVDASLQGCIQHLRGGSNTISLTFSGTNLSEQYVGGGYLRVIYSTGQLEEGEESSLIYRFPGLVDGYLNVYSSFHVPGTVTNISARIMLRNNYTTMLVVGNKVIFNVSGSPDWREINLTIANFTQVGLTLAELSNRTVPLRLYTPPELARGFADVVVLTDLSGSMRHQIANHSRGVDRECCNGAPCPNVTELVRWMENDTNVIYRSDTSRVSLAKCLVKYFTYKILNLTGNKVALVAFNDSIVSSTSLLENYTTLESTINTYNATPGSGACLCCALNRAHEILAGSPAGRARFVVLMSDGIPTHHCGGGCDGTGTTSFFEGDCWGCWYCCPVIDADNPSGCLHPVPPGYDCLANYDPDICCGYWWDENYCTLSCRCSCEIRNTYSSASRLNTGLNARVYTVGFGPIADCYLGNRTLSDTAYHGGGDYLIGDPQQPQTFRDIYRRVAEKILNVSFQLQPVYVAEGFIPANLSHDSYIKFTYIPKAERPRPGEVEVTFSTDPFGGCEGSVSVPPVVKTVSNAEVTAFSGPYWLHRVLVNGQPAFNLADYGQNYTGLGDPFVVYLLSPGVGMQGGVTYWIRASSSERPGGVERCSKDTQVILTYIFNASVPLGAILPRADGCNWTVEFFDGSRVSFIAPSGYTGGKKCSYTNHSISYDRWDAYDDAVYRLLSSLDISPRDGRVDVKFSAEDVVITSTTTPALRALWGPLELKLIVWAKRR